MSGGHLPLDEVILSDLLVCSYKQKKFPFARRGEQRHREVTATRDGHLIISKDHKRALFALEMCKALSLKSKKLPTDFNNAKNLLTIKFRHTNIYLVLVDEKICQWMAVLQELSTGSRPAIDNYFTPGRREEQQNNTDTRGSTPWNSTPGPVPFYSSRELADIDEDDEEEKEQLCNFVEAVTSSEMRFFDAQQMQKTPQRRHSTFRKLLSRMSITQKN